MKLTPIRVFMKNTKHLIKNLSLASSIAMVGLSLPASAETFSLFSNISLDEQSAKYQVTLNDKLNEARTGDLLQFTFHGQVHDLAITDIKRRADGKTIVIGFLDEFQHASVLTLSDVGVMGRLVTKDQYWALTLNTQGQWLVSSTNDDRRAVKVDEGGVAIPNRSPVAEVIKPTRELTVGGIDIIDVMVFWDQALENRLGSASAVEALIAQRIAMTNQAFIDSEIHAEIRYVFGEKRDYSSLSSNASLLETLQANTGVFSDVESLRTTHGADTVVYLRQFTANSGSAGIAYRLGENGQMTATDNRYAYSVVADGEYTQNRTIFYAPENTFSHELGHNLGSEHDHSHSNGETPIYSYAFGHDVPGEFATIMSYDEPPVLRYSNPDILCTATLACGVESGQVNPADNARAFNQTASMVASFKDVVYSYESTDFVKNVDSTSGDITVSYLPNNSLVYSFGAEGFDEADVILDANTGVSELNFATNRRLQINRNGLASFSDNCCFMPKSGFSLPVHFEITQSRLTTRLSLTSNRLEF